MHTTLYMACSIDGKITKGDDNLTNWVKDADVERMDALMEECGVMIMGSKTYESFGDELPNDVAHQVIFTSNQKYLDQKIDNITFTSDNPKDVLAKLEEKGYTKVMIAGGAAISTSFVKENLIDEIRLIVKPIIIGNGKSIFNEISDMKQFQHVSSEKLENGAVEMIFKKE